MCGCAFFIHFIYSKFFFIICKWGYKYEGCSKSIGPLVGKNTIIYLDV